MADPKMLNLRKLVKEFEDDEKVINTLEVILELMKQIKYGGALNNATMTREFKSERMTIRVTVDRKYPYA